MGGEGRKGASVLFLLRITRVQNRAQRLAKTLVSCNDVTLSSAKSGVLKKAEVRNAAARRVNDTYVRPSHLHDVVGIPWP